MRYTLSVFILLFSCASVQAQLRGKVTGMSGEPLPFASVYVQGTTNGTTTNLEGVYNLELDQGRYEIVFQYIGFKTRIETVQVNGSSKTLNVQLEPEAISLREIEIVANAEDPAYPIIRKAIGKRTYYRDQVEQFTCNVYIKGNVKILDAPDKVLGKEIGDLEGSLDTNRQGIVYLSESVSKLYFKRPDHYKEVMISSKVSGNDNGFSFNSAQDMDINLYRNYNTFGRNVISPIADGAMNYYKYQLEGVLVDEAGRLINKIKVWGKRSEDPVFQGHIYIIDSLWNIKSADLFVTGDAVQMPLVDTFHIRQSYVPVAGPDIWRMFSQTFSLTGGAFGFKFGGNFTGIYTDYDLSPGLSGSFFGNEIMKVEEGANEKDTAYWNETRPVPLTPEESVDYHRKDSIQEVRESKAYLDSMDRRNNRFKVVDILLGYTYRNSYKRQSFEFNAPLGTFLFNAVQGFNLDLGVGYNKSFDKRNDKKIKIGGKLNYGFSEDLVRASGSARFNYNPKKYARVGLSGGREVAQYNEVNPISPVMNTNWSLYFHRHNIRLYDKRFLKAEHFHEISNGVLMFVFGQYANRSPLSNHSDYSFFFRDREYAPNIPVNDLLEAENLDRPSRAVTGGVSFRLRPGQKYFDYPDRKYVVGSKFPDLWIHYRRGFSLQSGTEEKIRSDVDYDRLSVVVQKRNIQLGLVGLTSFRLEAGKFINNRQLYFQDFKHFLGNEIEVANSERYLYGYKMLPYYSYSTRNSWLEAHLEHNFQGFITDKLPLLRKWDWMMVAGANFLYTSEQKDYLELSLGFDNLGVGILRLFRFDATAAFVKGHYDGLGWLFGVNLPINEVQF